MSQLHLPDDIGRNSDECSHGKEIPESCCTKGVVARIRTEGNVQTETEHTGEVIVLCTTKSTLWILALY